jgi:CelD/BcsL family acetyltransferase involved in cellulose biosynthesis
LFASVANDRGRNPELQGAAVLEATDTRNLLHWIDPLQDARWSRFVEKHPRSSVFHTVGWQQALRETYGYQPIAATTTPPGSELQDGIALCRVNSWLTGNRLVSLPFSDHCEPLVDDSSHLSAMLDAMKPALRRDRAQYLELRPLSALHHLPSYFYAGQLFCFHHIDLTPDLDQLFRNCHKDSTQRKIRRAEREGLRYEEGRSEFLLDIFYRLMVLTRRRHQVPPQPKEWFQNLISCCGEALKIRVTFKDDEPTAAILTLRHKDTLVYKYGCSDARFNNLGGMHLLLWKSMQEAKASGLNVFDLGRSDPINQGLITFKDRWGGIQSELTYSRYSTSGNGRKKSKRASAGWKERFAEKMFAHMPDRLLHSVGALLYRHVG